MGPGLQLVGARFTNFLLGKLSQEFKFAECRYFTKFKWPYFDSASRYSQIVGYAGSTTGIVHADVTLIRSKVKVKVTGLLNFRKLAKPYLLAAMTVSPLAGLSGFVFASTLLLQLYYYFYYYYYFCCYFDSKLSFWFHFKSPYLYSPEF